MGMRMLVSVVEAAFSFFIFVLLIRSWMIAFRLPFRHPIGEFIRVCTGWLTRPFEGRSLNHTRFVIIPLLLAWVLEFALLQLVIALTNTAFIHPTLWWILVLIAMTNLLSKALLIAIVAIFLQAILSWVNPFAPIMGFLTNFTNPLLRPLRRLIPTVGGLDFSPMIAIIVCWMLYHLLTNWHLSPLFF